MLSSPLYGFFICPNSSLQYQNMSKLTLMLNLVLNLNAKDSLCTSFRRKIFVLLHKLDIIAAALAPRSLFCIDMLLLNCTAYKYACSPAFRSRCGARVLRLSFNIANPVRVIVRSMKDGQMVAKFDFCVIECAVWRVDTQSEYKRHKASESGPGLEGFAKKWKARI
jgi:hypothetical protein